MAKAYIYDVEIWNNFFCVTFIPEDVPQKLIDGYIKADTLRLNALYNKDSKLAEKYENDKARIFKAFDAKQFVIWRSLDGKDFRNDLMLLQNFFYTHKILTGYNSHNYDRCMLTLLLTNAKYVNTDTWHTKEKMFITEFLYKKSQECIDYGNGYYYTMGVSRNWISPFTNYDIQKILYLDKSFTSLKQVAINLKWYRIQELPIHYTASIKKDDIPDILDYNVNDDLITLTLKRNVADEIELREEISEEFGIDVRNLSRSSIGKAIATDLYSKFSGLDKKAFYDLRTDRRVIYVKDLISDEIQFQTPMLHNLLERVREQKIRVGSKSKEDKFEYVFKFVNNFYTMALGGLHSKDPSGIIIADEFRLIDADVKSYYPTGILKYRVCPEHLEVTPFRATVGHATKTRLEAKDTSKKLEAKADEIQLMLNNGLFESNKFEKVRGDIEYIRKKAKSNNTKAEGLKIAINRMYGAFRDANDFFYDPVCTYKTTINLQLALLMLIEDLEVNGIEVVSANTDGIVAKVYPDKEEIYNQVCDKWQKRNNFELEFTDYERYLRNDVNNYIAIKKGFDLAISEVDSSLSEIGRAEEYKKIEKKFIKAKGLFIEKIQFNKGYNAPVVAKALNLHLIYGIPYEQTIMNHINSSKEAIYDYCISQKSDRKFKIYYEHIVDRKVVREELQKANRFYISITKTGTIIKEETQIHYISNKVVEKKKTSKIVAKFSVEPFNTFIIKDEYPLDFGYYKKECSKILYGKNKKTDGIIKLQYKSDIYNDHQIDLFEGSFNPTIQEVPKEETEVKREPIEYEVDNSFLIPENIEENHIDNEPIYWDDTNDLPFDEESPF